jgi:hypothetical protein
VPANVSHAARVSHGRSCGKWIPAAESGLKVERAEENAPPNSTITRRGFVTAIRGIVYIPVGHKSLISEVFV